MEVLHGHFVISLRAMSTLFISVQGPSLAIKRPRSCAIWSDCRNDREYFMMVPRMIQGCEAKHKEYHCNMQPQKEKKIFCSSKIMSHSFDMYVLKMDVFNQCWTWWEEPADENKLPQLCM